MKSNLLLILFLTISTSCLFAQLPDIQNYTNGEYVNDFVFEGDFIWIATSGGLVKYNQLSGESTFFNRSNSGLPINEIWSIEIDQNGTIWLGTQIGLAEFDGANWKLHHPPNFLIGILDLKISDSGRFFMRSASRNLWEYDGNTWTKHDVFGGDIYWFDIGENDLVWAARNSANKTNVYQFDGDSAKIMDLPIEDYCASWSCRIDFLTLDSEKQLWFILEGDYLGKPMGDSWEIEELNFRSERINFSETDLWLVDDDDIYRRPLGGGNWTNFEYSRSEINYAYYLWESQLSDNHTLWLGTEKGIYKLDTETDLNIEKIQSSNSGLFSNEITRLTITNDQTVWSSHGFFDYGTPASEGLSRFANHEWTSITSQPNDVGYPYNIRDIKGDKNGNLWVAAHDFLAKRSNSIWTKYDSVGTQWNVLYSLGIHPTTQEIWVSGTGQIAKLDGDAFELIDTPVPFSESEINQIEISHSGDIWIASPSFGEVGKLSNGEWTVYDSTQMELPYWTSNIRELAIAPNGHIWVLANSGIAVFDGEEWKSWHYFNTNSGLPSRAISIAFDGLDKTWIGYYEVNCFVPSTYLGLTKIEGDTWTNYWFNDTDLPYPNITALAVDSFHNVWIGTESAGVAVFNENEIILNSHSPTLRNQIAPITIEIIPNPFVHETTLKYELATNSEVQLSVISAEGVVVLNKKLGQKMIGNYEEVLRKENLSSGVYFVSIRAGNYSNTSKVVLLE